MTTRIVTEERARQIILSQCRQFVEDTPWDEAGHLWDNRCENLANHLTAQTGANIGDAMYDLRELLTTVEELQSVEAGTHHRILINHALTIDNRPDLRDELTRTLGDNMSELLTVAGFLPAKQAAA